MVRQDGSLLSSPQSTPKVKKQRLTFLFSSNICLTVPCLQRPLFCCIRARQFSEYNRKEASASSERDRETVWKEKLSFDYFQGKLPVRGLLSTITSLQPFAKHCDCVLRHSLLGEHCFSKCTLTMLRYFQALFLQTMPNPSLPSFMASKSFFCIALNDE